MRLPGAHLSMNRRFQFLSLLVAALSSALLGCHGQTKLRRVQNTLPPNVLWAWERPEDLEFIDPQRFAVAFLAQTLTLTADDVLLTPRRQPLRVSPATKLIAVTRIESQKRTGTRPALSEKQRDRLVTLVTRTLELPNVSAIQVDFDVLTSEREFYRSLLQELREKTPDNVPLSMTALASFCVGDRWLSDLPVDEAVPMIFRMGTDERKIKTFLEAGNDFLEPLCQTSYGITLDEPLAIKFKSDRRVYVFATSSWTAEAVASLEERLRR